MFDAHTPDAATPQILHALRGLLRKADAEHPGGRNHPLIFMDFDGTVMRGDVAEGLPATADDPGFVGMAEHAVKAGLSRRYAGDEGYRAFWAEYEHLVQTDETRSVTFLAEEFADLSAPQQHDLAALCADVFESTLRYQIFQSSLEIIDAMVAEGVDVRIVSAGVEVFMKHAAGVLPISEDQISAVNRDTRDGELVDPILNFEHGKIERIQQTLDGIRASGRRPVVLGGFGNSWNSDGPFLVDITRRGGLGVMINGGDPPMADHGLVTVLQQAIVGDGVL